jgi:hypothetical protein
MYVDVRRCMWMYVDVYGRMWVYKLRIVSGVSALYANLTVRPTPLAFSFSPFTWGDQTAPNPSGFSR